MYLTCPRCRLAYGGSADPTLYLCPNCAGYSLQRTDGPDWMTGSDTISIGGTAWLDGTGSDTGVLVTVIEITAGSVVVRHRNGTQDIVAADRIAADIVAV